MNASSRRAAGVLAGALLAGLLGDALAASQLYKCVDGGRTVYQQQACSPSAQPEIAASTPAKASAPNVMAKASAPAASPAAVPPHNVKAPASPASSAPAKPR